MSRHPLMTPDVVEARKTLWLPGVGNVRVDVRETTRAVEEYDDNLTLGQDQRTGDYVVLLKRGPDGEPFPVLGLGPRLPGADEVKKRLYESDVRRHGSRIVQQIERINEKRRNELRARAEDASGQMAEAFDWGLRNMGSHPFPRIFVPGGK